MKNYTRFLLFIGGLGGLLYGIDFGVIAVSMPYIKALGYYTDAQISWIVGAVMFGGILASASAGVLCDKLGRKKTIVIATLLFVLAIPIVCFSGTSLTVMLIGRVLQGMSAGYVAVAMPMFLAETLPPETRGRGTGIFQLFLGIGLVTAALAGILISTILGAADAPLEVVDASAKSLAWRINFWWTLLPVSVLLFGSLFLKESPVWLKLRGLPRTSAPTSDTLVGGDVPSAPLVRGDVPGAPHIQSLWQRKYILPFVLAVLALTFNKTIGMSSIVAYSVSLFQKAGLSGTLANVGDLALKSTNLIITLVAISLIDRKGRTWLLKIGTGGLTIGLAIIGVIFMALERNWLPSSSITGFITLAAFLAMQIFYSLGPGICIWLVLSELMPTRIRAHGMAIALFANQFVAWGLASSFFPMVDSWGYGMVFLGFAASGVLYFITVLFIPETKGLTLEEIEKLWSKK